MKLRLPLLLMCLFCNGLFATAQISKKPTSKPIIENGPDAIPVTVTSTKKSKQKHPPAPPKIVKRVPPPPPPKPVSLHPTAPKAPNKVSPPVAVSKTPPLPPPPPYRLERLLLEAKKA